MSSVLLGFNEDGTPIWLITGAEGETEEDNAEEEEEDDTEEDDTEEDDDKGERKQPKSGKKEVKAPAKKATAKGYTPPSQREWEKTQAALRAANDAQRSARKAALEKAKQEGMTEAAAEARAKAIEEAEGTYKPRVVRTEAKAQLLEMGCKNPSRLIKLVDISKVTFEGDDLLGLEGQLNELKEEWPELFRDGDDEDPKKDKKDKKTVAPAKKVGAAAGAKKTEEPGEKKKSTAESIAARLIGVSAE